MPKSKSLRFIPLISYESVLHHHIIAQFNDCGEGQLHEEATITASMFERRTFVTLPLW